MVASSMSETYISRGVIDTPLVNLTAKVALSQHGERLVKLGDARNHRVTIHDMVTIGPDGRHHSSPLTSTLSSSDGFGYLASTTSKQPRRRTLSDPVERPKNQHSHEAGRYANDDTRVKLNTPGTRHQGRPALTSGNHTWELELIEKLIDEDVDCSVVEALASERALRRRSEKSVKLHIKKISRKPVLRTIQVEPEVELGSKSALEVQQLAPPRMLTTVKAFAITDEVLDEFDYGSDVDSDTVSILADNDHEVIRSLSPVSPLSPAVHSDFPSPISDSTDPMHLLEFSAVPEIRLVTEDWPLLPTEADYTEQLIAPAPHPHPLRANPTHSAGTNPHKIHKVASESSLRSARTTQSNHSHRTAFVMQKNDSSLSLHTQDTITDMTDLLAAPAMQSTTSFTSNPTTKTSTPALHKFSERLNLKRANAVYSHSHAHSQSSTHTGRSKSKTSLGLAMLTPVSETFEKLTGRKESEAETRRPSASLSRVGGSGKSEKKTKKEKRIGFAFQGALVGASRRHVY